jgi:hypothetical protein
VRTAVSRRPGVYVYIYIYIYMCVCVCVCVCAYMCVKAHTITEGPYRALMERGYAQALAIRCKRRVSDPTNAKRVPALGAHEDLLLHAGRVVLATTGATCSPETSRITWRHLPMSTAFSLSPSGRTVQRPLSRT